jgi:hypothetical protein
MAETTLDALARRVDLLERRLRKWKVAVAIGGIALSALAGMVTFFAYSGIKPVMGSVGEIAARKFVVVNQAGDPIATLGSLGDGAITSLILMPSRALPSNSKEVEKWITGTLQAAAERGGAAFLASKDYSTILLGGRQGPQLPDFGAELTGGRKDARILLKSEPDSARKAAEISLYTSEFHGLEASASLTSPGGRTVTLTASDAYQAGKYDIPGQTTVNLSEPPPTEKGRISPHQAEFHLKSDGSAGLEFTDENYRTQAALDVDKDGNPYLDLFDNDGKLRAALGATDLEIVRTGASEKTAPSSLTLFDKKGKLIWRTPQ